ncbi:LysR family transcriptional regulator [Actinomyces israelii]|uniref:LysR family transcriptional regulator n=1 Tax=Actinomyces israelii TaxID=1659 RepID=UPI0005B83662|nr:LysR family transcriptional regulator [Actinomyces israelii]
MNDRLSPEGLRYAQAVARTGSFSAAAREHSLTQPALSNAIRRLEEALGDRLFERSTRGTTPTAFGAAILPRVDAALAALDTVTAEARHWHAPEPLPVRVGVSPLISAGVVARAQRAVAALPGRGKDSLVLREADLSELCAALDDGELDLIVVPAVLPLTRCRHRVIGSEPVVLVEPEAGDAGAPSAATAAARVDELAHRTLLLVPDTCGLTTFTRGLLADRGLPLRAYSGERGLLADRGLPLRAYSGEAASYRVLEGWAGMGLGSALLPRSKVTSVESRARPVVDVDGAAITIAYEAAWDGASPIADELESLAGGLASEGGP